MHLDICNIIFLNHVSSISSLSVINITFFIVSHLYQTTTFTKPNFTEEFIMESDRSSPITSHPQACS